VLPAYPVEFDDLIGKTFAMKVDVSQFNLDNKGANFTVAKHTNKPNIIQELTKKMTTLQVRFLSYVIFETLCLLISLQNLIFHIFRPLDLNLCWLTLMKLLNLMAANAARLVSNIKNMVKFGLLLMYVIVKHIQKINFFLLKKNKLAGLYICF
jgi:hypothetical protein